MCKPENIASRKVIENMGLKYQYIIYKQIDYVYEKDFIIQPFEASEQVVFM